MADRPVIDLINDENYTLSNISLVVKYPSLIK